VATVALGDRLRAKHTDQGRADGPLRSPAVNRGGYGRNPCAHRSYKSAATACSDSMR